MRAQKTIPFTFFSLYQMCPWISSYDVLDTPKGKDKLTVPEPPTVELLGKDCLHFRLQNMHFLTNIWLGIAKSQKEGPFDSDVITSLELFFLIRLLQYIAVQLPRYC